MGGNLVFYYDFKFLYLIIFDDEKFQEFLM